MVSDTIPLFESEEWLPVPLDLGGGSAPHGRLTDIWPVVLEARFVPYRLERDENGMRLLVPAGWLDTAVTELRLFEEENSNWPPPPPPIRHQEQNTLATASILLLIAIFHNLTLLKTPIPGVGTVDYTDIGSARANLIAGGDWWRAVTALTLHSGIVHLASNLLIGGTMMVFLCREVGSGLAWALAVAAGFLGNVANAHAQMPTHVSVGASTAVFGVIGILASLNMIRYRHVPRKWILPVAAGIALLVALGTEGERTDLGAHFFGFLAGIVLGAAAAPLGRVPKPANAVLAVASAAVVVIAWWLAIAA
jgi:rhomboid protease GluP